VEGARRGLHSLGASSSPGAQGVNMYTVAEIVDHQKVNLGLSMTSRYAGRETMEAKAACVRAVKLPAAKLRAIPLPMD
jgi:hypothetical protein